MVCAPWKMFCGFMTPTNFFQDTFAANEETLQVAPLSRHILKSKQNAA